MCLYENMSELISTSVMVILSSIYKALWDLPTPGLGNRIKGKRRKIKNATIW